MTEHPKLAQAAVEAIESAGEDPARWPQALGAIAAVTGDVGAILFFQQADGSFSAIVTPNLQPVLQDFAQSEWRDKDFRFMRAAERGFVESRQCITDRDVATDSEIETHGYYGFLRRHGLKYFAGLNVSPAPDVVAALSVQRSPERPPFSAEELAVVGGFGEHLRAALARNAEAIGKAPARGSRGAITEIGVEPSSETAALLSQLSGGRS